MFVGGQSAGGIIALGCAYYQTSADLVSDQSMIDASIPQASTSAYTIEQTLGRMHENFYYANNSPQYWPKIAGVASLWGGFVIPKSYDSNEVGFFKKISAAGNPPLIAFHGYNDTTIPFLDGPGQDIDLSPPLNANPDYNSTNVCTNNSHTFSQLSIPNTNPNNIELKICSSLNLYLVMKKLNQFSEFYLDCSMAHGLDDCAYCGVDHLHYYHKEAGNCVKCTYGSNFGTMAMNIHDTIVYMVQRIAVFSQAIMSAYPSTLAFNAKGRSYFKDCENKRTCNGAEMYDCAVDNTLCDNTPLPE